MKDREIYGKKLEQWPTVGLAVILGILLTTAILFIAFLWTRSPATAPIQIYAPPPPPTQEPSPTPGPFKVYLTGEVNNPGVVTVPCEARLEDAVRAAGGLTSQACSENVNMAARLEDGQHIHVPAVGEIVEPIQSTGSVGAEMGGLININTATEDELVQLPGIGEVTAAKILAYRAEHGEFNDIQEIMSVPGIGEGKFQALADFISVGP